MVGTLYYCMSRTRMQNSESADSVPIVRLNSWKRFYASKRPATNGEFVHQSSISILDPVMQSFYLSCSEFGSLDGAAIIPASTIGYFACGPGSKINSKRQPQVWYKQVKFQTSLSNIIYGNLLVPVSRKKLNSPTAGSSLNSCSQLNLALQKNNYNLKDCLPKSSFPTSCVSN